MSEQCGYVVKVKELRKHLKLTQAEFGEVIGLKATAIGMFEAEQRNVVDRNISLISEKFNVDEMIDFVNFLNEKLYKGKSVTYDIFTFITFYQENNKDKIDILKISHSGGVECPIQKTYNKSLTNKKCCSRA